MKIKILVATHKNYQMPTDPVYLPVAVGQALHPDRQLPYQGDDQGENISVKNPHYNELTAIYWGWKNLDVDAMGLVHYRRHFMSRPGRKMQDVISGAEVAALLEQYDVLLPKRRHYWIETNRSQFLHAHEHAPFETMEKVIKRDYPEYGAAFDLVMQRTWGHMFNMFIIKKEPLDQFSQWMFDVLGKVEAQTDVSTFTPYEQRVYGFLSEHLLDIWLEVHAEYRVKEIPYAFMEPTNWFKKGGNFLKRKLIGHR